MSIFRLYVALVLQILCTSLSLFRARSEDRITVNHTVRKSDSAARTSDLSLKAACPFLGGHFTKVFSERIVARTRKRSLRIACQGASRTRQSMCLCSTTRRISVRLKLRPLAAPRVVVESVDAVKLSERKGAETARDETRGLMKNRCGVAYRRLSRTAVP